MTASSFDVVCGFIHYRSGWSSGHAHDCENRDKSCATFILMTDNEQKAQNSALLMYWLSLWWSMHIIHVPIYMRMHVYCRNVFSLTTLVHNKATKLKTSCDTCLVGNCVLIAQLQGSPCVQLHVHVHYMVSKATQKSQQSHRFPYRFPNPRDESRSYLILGRVHVHVCLTPDLQSC